MRKDIIDNMLVFAFGFITATIFFAILYSKEDVFKKDCVIPKYREYYICETWKWEGDCPNTIKIPNGEFWGLIRYYNILGWKKVSEAKIQMELELFEAEVS